jgi:hypothetical protein
MKESEIFSCPSLCKSVGKTTCLLLWAPCHGSIWRILCIRSRILHCGLGGCEGLASRSDRLAPAENYTVPIEELSVLTAEPVCALLRRQKLLPFSGTEPRPVGLESAANRFIISPIPTPERLRMCTTVYAKYLCLEKHEGNGLLFGFCLKKMELILLAVKNRQIWFLSPYNHEIMFSFYMLYLGCHAVQKKFRYLNITFLQPILDLVFLGIRKKM